MAQMKRYIFAILIIGLLATFSKTSAQNTFIKTDFLGPLIENPFLVGIEFNKRKPGSFLINFEYGTYMRDKGEDFGQVTWRKRIVGFGIIPEYRRYLRYTSNLNKPVGIFVGGYARLFNLDYKQNFTDNSIVDDVEEKKWAGGLGLELGYKYKKPYKKLYAEVLVGAGFGYIDFDSFDNDYFPDQYLLARIELCVGYAFQ